MTSHPSKQFRFTKKEIDALPPQSRDAMSREAEYSDTECVGLKLLVNKRGRKFFYLRYSFRGRRRALKIGEVGSTSLVEARILASEFKSKVDRGVDPQAEKERIRAIPTFKTFVVNHYLPFAKESKRTYDDDKARLEKHVLPSLGRYTLQDLTPLQVQTLLMRCKQSGLAPATVNRIRSLILRVLNLAVQWKFIDASPVSGIPKLQENNMRQRFLNREEIPRFLAALDAQADQQSADFLHLLLLTGARLGELLNAQHGDVDLVTGIWRIPLSKSGRSRIVTLNDRAIEILSRQTARYESPYLFPGNPRYKKPRMAAPYRTFERVKEMAGLRDLRIHDLRHSYASIAVQSGASLYDVQKMLGHANPQMTQRYSHLSDERLRAVSNQVARAVADTLRPPQ